MEKPVIVYKYKPMPVNLLRHCEKDSPIPLKVTTRVLVKQSIDRKTKLEKCSAYMDGIISFNDEITKNQQTVPAASEDSKVPKVPIPLKQ